jgi:hypothetical protein
MSLRIVQFSLTELIHDAEAVSEALNRACRRAQSGYRVGGHFQRDGVVVFILEPLEGGEIPRYLLAPFLGESREDLIADVWSRWQGGWSTVGSIALHDSSLGLFEATEAKLRNGVLTA